MYRSYCKYNYCTVCVNYEKNNDLELILHCCNFSLLAPLFNHQSKNYVVIMFSLLFVLIYFQSNS